MSKASFRGMPSWATHIVTSVDFVSGTVEALVADMAALRAKVDAHMAETDRRLAVLEYRADAGAAALPTVAMKGRAEPKRPSVVSASSATGPPLVAVPGGTSQGKAVGPGSVGGAGPGVAPAAIAPRKGAPPTSAKPFVSPTRQSLLGGVGRGLNDSDSD